MGSGSNDTGNSHFNPHVVHLLRGYTQGCIHIFKIFSVCAGVLVKNAT